MVQVPQAAADRLVLLFHGVGARPDSLRPLAQALASADPKAAVICVQAPERSDVGFGWQWFSVRGVDEVNRPARVAKAMPDFVATVRHWQQHFALSGATTLLAGFSQGGMMALEATQVAAGLATRVAAIGARFAQPPRRAPDVQAVHVLHGEEDPVIPCARGVAACEQLQALGTKVTLDLFPGLGHDIDGRLTARLLERLAD